MSNRIHSIEESLKDTYWYVPTAYLSALQFHPGQINPFAWASDQTVWNIVESRDGYFVGKAYIEFRADDNTTKPEYLCRTLVGSMTPDGNVYLNFVPESIAGAAMATTGIGRVRTHDNGIVFEMQMTTGVTFLLAHWAYMEQCKPGEDAWEQLPGVQCSVPQFIAQCRVNY